MDDRRRGSKSHSGSNARNQSGASQGKGHSPKAPSGRKRSRGEAHSSPAHGHRTSQYLPSSGGSDLAPPVASPAHRHIERQSLLARSDSVEIPRSVRGAPAHLKAAIRKRQNSESAKRSRERRKEVYRKLFDKFHEHTRQIAALEVRVSALVEVLNLAGIDVPSNLVREVYRGASASSSSGSSDSRGGSRSSDSGGQRRQYQERMTAEAHADIAASVGNIAENSPLFRPGSPSNNELFEEMMKMLGAADDGAGPSESRGQ